MKIICIIALIIYAIYAFSSTTLVRTICVNDDMVSWECQKVPYIKAIIMCRKNNTYIVPNGEMVNDY